jgi:hypothetical protein
MGGQAFASLTPPLSTPRMPPEIYFQVLAETHSILRKYFSHVESAVEAPGKETYGDVDTIVFGPLDPELDSSKTDGLSVAEKLAEVLGAKKFVRERGNPTVNFAIHWPVVKNSRDDQDGNREDRYIQLDVHICHSPKSFKWELFHAAHGDLWNILGSTIRRFGLTVNDRGLYFRIPEIELLDRKKSMIFLTDEPGEVLQFLGLNEDRWWKQFGSREELFQYAATCRMFWIKEEIENGEAEGDVVGEIEGQEGGEKGKKKLKHNDRQRMEKRPMFKAWIDEFIPECREQGIFGNTKITREEIQADAFSKFGIKEEYETRLKEWRLARHIDNLWRDVIKGCVPIEDVDPALRAAALRTLKATIMEGVEFDGTVPKAAEKDDEGFYDVNEVRAFVLGNWEKAGRIGLQRQEAKAIEAMKAKTEKKQLEAEKKETEERKRKQAPT